ncbi:MAG: YgeY family selenium metabolism-linked hydrolase [Selenomonadaceae bacterium]
MLTREKTTEVIELCQRMVRVKSYSGEEKELAEVMRDFFQKHGLTDIRADRYGNLIVSIQGKRPGRTILFDGHMDTVPVTNASAWEHDPFAAEIADGKIYGRGTSDMKGALAAMACAVVRFVDATDADFAGNLCLAGVVHEECFEGVAARAISAAVKPDVVIIGEASELNVKIGQRGRAEIVVETFGKAAHSANPEKGINAVYHMSKVIDAIQAIKPSVSPVLGKGILELTDIKSSPYPGASVVPEYCRATYDRRLLTGETRESVLAPIEKVMDTLMQTDSTINAKVSYAKGQEQCYTGNKIEGERFFPGWLYDEKEDFVQAVLGQLRQDGFSPKVTQYNFCTNGSHYAGEAGIKTMGIGPSRENLAHRVDEYIEIDQLTSAVKCYYNVMEALLK